MVTLFATAPNIGLFCLPLSEVPFLMLSLTLGILFGIQITYMALFPLQLFGREAFTDACGKNCFAAGIGVLAGGPFAGMVIVNIVGILLLLKFGIAYKKMIVHIVVL